MYHVCKVPQRQALACKTGVHSTCLPVINANHQPSWCKTRAGLRVGQDQDMAPSMPAVSMPLPVTTVHKFPDCTPVTQRQELPAAATSAAIELLPNSTVIALSQQQPSAAAATQPSAGMPTAATGGTLDVLPPHDLSGPSASRLLKHVREGQGRLKLKVKGPTMPLPAVPTAASQPIGTLGAGQPISAPQKGRQTVTQTELLLSTQPKLPFSTQSGAVHRSPMNQIILDEPARSQTNLASGPATEPPQTKMQNPQQRSESAAETAVHPLSPPRGSPLSPVKPLGSPRGPSLSPVNPLGSPRGPPLSPVHPLSSPRGSPLSPVHSLSSPRSSATSSESARRQWLLTDSFRQRQATCKEALKAAQQDVLKWLKDQKVVHTGCFLCLL